MKLKREIAMVTSNADKLILLLIKLIIIVLEDWKIRSSAAFSSRASGTIPVPCALVCDGKGKATRPPDQTS